VIKEFPCGESGGEIEQPYDGEGDGPERAVQEEGSTKIELIGMGTNLRRSRMFIAHSGRNTVMLPPKS